MTELVVLRPEPGASATARLARELGLRPIKLPLFTLVPRDWRAPDASGFDAIIMTSAYAAQHSDAALRAYLALPIYVVGAATACAARGAGFVTVIEAGPDVAHLVGRLQADGRTRILDLGGRDRTPFAPGTLAITRRIVYAADPIAVDAALLAGLADARAVFLLHSARAAERLAMLIEPARAHVAALGTKVLGSSDWAAHVIAATPDDRALLAAAARLCDQRSR